MLGWINLSIESFITDTFGADKWQEVLAASGVHKNWVSSCPYSDKITYDLVITAAGILGVGVNQALEAYGQYFVKHVKDNGYTNLLHVLGSNVADFLQNLNNLHLHLSMGWPSMVAPAFRCEQVTPESLLLHYYSSRPGLWPIVVGVLKGMSKEFFGFEVGVALEESRELGADHEVFRLTYPFQETLRDYDAVSVASARSLYAMPPDLFYRLHPFHLLLDTDCRLLQGGPGMARVAPNMQRGDELVRHFKLRHPYIPVDYTSIVQNANTVFLFMGRESLITLKGQMVAAHLPGSIPGAPPQKVLLFLGSPRCSNLQEMQAQHLYLSDIPLHDMSRDFVLLAEQRQAEADLKERFEKMSVELKAANEKLAKTTAWLEEEKARAEALLYRMSSLISCFPAGPEKKGQSSEKRNSGGSEEPDASVEALAALLKQAGMVMGSMAGTSDSTARSGDGQQRMEASTLGLTSASRHTYTMDRIEQVRRDLARANMHVGDLDAIECRELLGEGTFGKVYKGLWKGSVVAIKTIVLPAMMSGAEKREKMAIMEAAISSALSHPNILQTYTYDIKPLRDNSSGSNSKLVMGIQSEGSENSNIHSFEVRLVLEYCDRGSLREVLDKGAFRLEGAPGGINYCAVLDTAIDIATAIAHLHGRNVLHSDLKARNIMLKSNGAEGRGVSAKVADFGLSVKMDHMDTHLSNAFQGTMTHMAPEIMMKGRISKAGDVYAFGIMLWELYTAQHVFKGVPKALLGHHITLLNKRPEFGPDAPRDYVALATRCWDPKASHRPNMEEALAELQHLRRQEPAATPHLGAYDLTPPQAVDGSGRAKKAAEPVVRSIYLDQSLSTIAHSRSGSDSDAHSQGDYSEY